jgi:hypothetical protein
MCINGISISFPRCEIPAPLCLLGLQKVSTNMHLTSMAWSEQKLLLSVAVTSKRESAKLNLIWCDVWRVDFLWLFFQHFISELQPSTFKVFLNARTGCKRFFGFFGLVENEANNIYISGGAKPFFFFCTCSGIEDIGLVHFNTLFGPQFSEMTCNSTIRERAKFMFHWI